MDIPKSKLKKVTKKDLYDISFRSAGSKGKQIFIFEKSDLSKIIGNQKAEILRKEFLKNKIQIKQITNIPTLPPFTQNDEFVNECMSFRYVSKDIFTINHEILIFDDITAIYNVEPELQLLIIENKHFAINQKQLFMTLWEQGQLPKLGFKYDPNHSFFNSIDFHIDGKQVIVWPDKEAVKAYFGMSYKDIEKYIKEIIYKDEKYFKDSDYLVAFMWRYKKDKMIDIWKFDSNYVDDRSGPLGEVRIYRNQSRCTNLGMASGNTLLVLGYEEKLRRQSKDLQEYLEGPPPGLPLEILNGKDFFKSN